jgi:hypothetical protein
MPKAYVAGPMRGIPLYNFPAFDAAARLGRALGWEVISPAEMDRAHGFSEHTQADGADVFTAEKTREFIRRDMNVLVNVLRAEDGDAIALLPGWEKSTGARAEKAIAEWAKLRIISATTFGALEDKCAA